MSTTPLKIALSSLVLLAVVLPLPAELVSLSVSGRISQNTTADSTIPIGTPWTFELVYNTASPDTDFELTGVADPTFGRFTNSGAIPALVSFHYRAGSYEVILNHPSDFSPFSNLDITFLPSIHAIDINIVAAGLFPPLAGGAVTFHADFNDSTHSALKSDALPTDPTIGVQSFQDSSVTLLPPSGVILGASQDITRLTVASVPEPSFFGLTTVGVITVVARRRPGSGRK